MDARQEKQWKVTVHLLALAATEVESLQGYSEYADYMAHNEFECALDVLESIGNDTKVSPNYWWHLKKAAEVMGLRSRYATFRKKRLQALKQAHGAC